jgi:uncharacterized protein (TIGR02246 family)
MKSVLLLSIFFALFTDACFAQNKDIEQIKKLNADWLNAYPKRDSTLLSSILADDFMMVSPDGSKQTKKDNLLNIMLPSIETISVSFDNVEVRLLTPYVAVLNAWANFVFKANGKEMTGRNCYQDVYMKRKGKWLAVSAHVTSLNSR